MSYDLSRYKIQPGDRVSIPEAHGGTMRHYQAGILIAEWDASKSHEGTVVRVWKSGSGNAPPWIDVAPDEGVGFGVFTFPVRDISHLTLHARGQRDSLRQNDVISPGTDTVSEGIT